MSPIANLGFSRRVSLAILVIAAATGAACTKRVGALKPSTPADPTPVVARNDPPPERPAVTNSRPPAAVEAAKPRYPDAVTRARIDQLLSRIEDAYFDYDRAILRPDAIKALAADSGELRDILKDYPDYKLSIEGHCDERGSAEYNIALGEQRANAAKAYLVGVGIPDGQLNTVSYGKERPVCADSTEACYQKNRRIHIVALAR